MHHVLRKKTGLTENSATPSLLDRFIHRQFKKILDGIRDGELEVVWPDESCTHHGSGAASATISLNSYEPVRKLFFSGQLGFAESYLLGQWTTDDLCALFDLIMRNERRISDHITGGLIARLRSSIEHTLNRNTLLGSRKNIAYHYDLGNEFYSLWLDNSMSYSSAVYLHDKETLEQAQQNKINRIVELLSPSSQSKVLEIGCGWGSLAAALSMATNAQVNAISLSNAQLSYARQNNECSGVDFNFSDYRAIEERYDHIVSVEMFEAVGMAYWDTYFRRLSRLLKTGGNALLQIITIAEDRFANYRRNPDFIQRYVFPGGMLPTGTIIEQLIQRYDFELTSVEWFGDSYAKTVSVWRSNFESALPQIRELGYDDRFIRMWRYYLAYCEIGFKINQTNVGMFVITRR